jgi:hypothetical protein
MKLYDREWTRRELEARLGRIGRRLAWHSMSMLQKDRSILRQLADQQAAIACLPIHTEKVEEWKPLRLHRKITFPFSRNACAE